MSIEEIRSFIAVPPTLATGGQPTEQQWWGIADRGFEVVVNLGLVDQDYSLADEAGLVRSLGLEYHHIPVDFEAPTLGDLHRFTEVMDAYRGRRVFVHCAANMRVSCFVSLYAEACLGWSREQAKDLVRQVWEPNEVWTQFLADAREELATRPD